MTSKLLFFFFFCVALVLCQDFSAESIVAKYDTNGDGELDIHEFEELFKTVFGNDHAHGHEEEHAHEHGHEGEEEALIFGTLEGNVNNCLQPDAVFESADLDMNGFLNREELGKNATSTLVLMTLEGCTILEPAECKETSKVASWLGGIFASIIISLISLVAVILIPFDDKRLQSRLLPGLIALAIGCLVGDAILHLIPYALEVHSHDEGLKEEPGEYDYWGPMCMVLIGIGFFFALEQILGHVHVMKTGQKMHEHSQPTSPEERELKSPSDPNLPVSTEKKPAGYMNLVSDALHNLIDGLALGAAFSSSAINGVSTAIAICLHEIPQEFGDFGILIKSGWTKRSALLANLFSALFCVLGTLIGLGAGENKGFNRYILGFVAGNFLYIALATMVKEVVEEKNPKFKIFTVFIVFLGFAIMLLLSYLEEAINFC